MSELTLKRLEYFSAVAEEGNVTRAARRLHISQPALSLQLKMLEEAVGQRLMNRTARGIALTSAGSALRAEAETMLNQAQLLKRRVVTAGEQGRGSLTLGVSPVACEYFLPFTLARFRRRFPGIDVRVAVGDAPTLDDKLQAKTIDLAVTRQRHEILSESSDSDLEMTVLLEERLILAVPGDNALTAKPQVNLADLADERLIMYSRSRGPRYFDALVTACRDRGGFDPTDIVEADSLGAQIALIAGGYGVGFVTDLSSLRAAGDIVFLNCRDLKIESPTVMIARRSSAAACAFSEVARDTSVEFTEAFRDQLIGDLVHTTSRPRSNLGEDR
jgi:DNA-binding transcriptional LysR family regulator